ncbi:hypothetical protein PCCS19_01000 [Paenibacillus sp. CCS19]|uniref:hypothetical protein n=1 Tax=Paenibacillus sp. CCS19 TaxID=3158387 RepID=UPI00255D636F|nr:hypothetical protein [Paenibacillus cellulosilyticus]GMK37047.1 hypothetical protein PCCS19_01000 [Paenibacillus cellulosilyticus]
MKKALVLCAVVATLAVGGTAVYAQVNNGQETSSPVQRMFTQQESDYYSQIIIDVESGKLPPSEINKARDYILKHPEVNQSIIDRYHIKYHEKSPLLG